VAVNETKEKTQQEDAKPDIDSATTETWPAREFPINGRGQRNYVQVVMRRSVLNEIHQHGLSDTDVEVCGVLVGDGYLDQRGPYLYVEHIVQGEHSDSKAAQVTFTAETWNHIQTTLDKEHPEKRIVGWYHTHPGFGIFLSDMDMFIHENFFGGDEQLALVYDPIGGDQGLFVWRDGKAVRDGLLIEEDAKQDSESAEEAPERPSLTAGADQEPNNGMESRLAKLEKQQTVTFAALFFATILAIGWPIAASQLGLLEQERSAPTRTPTEDNRRQAPPPRTVPNTRHPRKVDDTTKDASPPKKPDNAESRKPTPQVNSDNRGANEIKPNVGRPENDRDAGQAASEKDAKPPEDKPGSSEAPKGQP